MDVPTAILLSVHSLEIHRWTLSLILLSYIAKNMIFLSASWHDGDGKKEGRSWKAILRVPDIK